MRSKEHVGEQGAEAPGNYDLTSGLPGALFQKQPVFQKIKLELKSCDKGN